MSTVTITITEDTSQFTQPDDIDGVPTTASLRDDTVAAPASAPDPDIQIDAELDPESS